MSNQPLKKQKKLKPAKKNKLSGKSKRQLGLDQEQRAAAYLTAHNYRILDQNFQYQQFEIDLIAEDRTTHQIVFVEVKYRQQKDFGYPSQAVDKRKLNRIQQAAWVYLDQKQIKKQFRFDIISLLPDQIEHFKNVSVEL